MATVIESPFNKYQTFLPRIFAAVIDSLVILGIGKLLSLFLSKDATGPKDLYIIFLIINNILVLIYFAFSNSRSGQTLGKKIMNLKVTALDESSLLNYGNAFMRESLRFIVGVALIIFAITKSENSYVADSDTYPLVRWIGFYSALIWVAIELITMLLNRKTRALHDFIAGSVVIRIK